MADAVYASQKKTTEVLQNDSGKIYGKVTDVITASGFTTEMPMRNFHSKSLQRDFSIIYFITRYITDKETSTIYYR